MIRVYACVYACVYVCVCAGTLGCLLPSRQSARFFLGRLFWHDLDGTFLCGRQGPLPSGISLCTKIRFLNWI